jgi:hypothetical protein
VALADDPLSEDPHFLDHQQPHVSNDVGGQLVVLDVIAVDVESEVLPCRAPPFEKSTSKSKTTRLSSVSLTT